MIALLRLLSDRPQEWRHGYDLMKQAGLLSGTLYPLLMRMGDQGLVEAQWQEPTQPGRPPRHAYRLTAQGLELAYAMMDGAPDSGSSGALPA